jgi:hypothetical protein
MTMTARSKGGWIAAGLLALGIPSCSSEGSPLSVLCCTEFKVGADLSAVDFGLQGQVRGQFIAFAQASADLAATAAATLQDVQHACRNIAVELGASEADILDAEAKPDRERTAALCRLAVAQIDTRVTGRAPVTVAFRPPACEVSVQAQARCAARCAADGRCDVRATPPVCRGGKLQIACEGECKAKAGATLYCEGSCTGTCQGACTAEGGVRCNGRCEGTCTAEGSATGQAFDAQGNCLGTCRGTCEATPPGVRCEGFCKGTCDAACRAEANASVTCDGACSGEWEPIRCQGGTLEGGCEVEARCRANCDASAAARAECRPPQVDVRVATAVDSELGHYLEVLRTNLPPLIVVLQARGQAFVDLVGNLASSAGASGSAVISGDLSARAAACLVPIATTIGEAAENVRVSMRASADVLATVNVR